MDLLLFGDNLGMHIMSMNMHIHQGKTLVTILALLFMKVLSAPQSDMIFSLPGQPPVPFKQYAGYVTVDQRSDRALFYYFVEAETEPESKPLVLWLNGGPGCSSFGVGALSENGPFQSKEDKLIRNSYSWNKEANVLYLETPAGVGFSYSNDPSYYMGVNDTKTADDNLQFLLGWFKKFPEYKTRELYLTGESYAGHYIPQLADLIVQTNKKQKIFNLKGIAIGNPLLDFYTDFNARAEFLWSHGLISDPTYEIMTTGCNYTRYVDEYYRGSVSSTCEQIHAVVDMEVSRYIDRYDVTLDVCLSSLLMQSTMLMPTIQKAVKTERVEPDVCVQDEATAYLNRPDVQKALHARLVGNVKNWQACSDVLEYDHLNLEIPTISLLGVLLNSGVRVLVYSGDQDSVIPLTGTRTLVNKLASSDLQLKSTVPYSVWFEGKQVAGWTQVFGNILSYATVRGASHEVPFSQPERSLVLLNAFLSGKPLPGSASII